MFYLFIFYIIITHKLLFYTDIIVLIVLSGLLAVQSMVDLQVVISRINKSCKRIFHGMKLVNISSKYHLLTAFAVLAAHYVFTVLGNLIHRDQILAENISRW